MCYLENWALNLDYFVGGVMTCSTSSSSTSSFVSSSLLYSLMLSSNISPSIFDWYSSWSPSSSTSLTRRWSDLPRPPHSPRRTQQLPPQDPGCPAPSPQLVLKMDPLKYHVCFLYH